MNDACCASAARCAHPGPRPSIVAPFRVFAPNLDFCEWNSSRRALQILYLGRGCVALRQFVYEQSVQPTIVIQPPQKTIPFAGRIIRSRWWHCEAISVVGLAVSTESGSSPTVQSSVPLLISVSTRSPRCHRCRPNIFDAPLPALVVISHTPIRPLAALRV